MILGGTSVIFIKKSDMKNKFPGQNAIKQWVKNSFLLQYLFISLYKLSGRRPWSLGYSVYKYRFIKNICENYLSIFRKETLPPHYGFKIDERAVEYPWFFSGLDENAITVLDAGAALNHVDILSLNCLRKRKLYVSTLFFEGFKKVANVPSYVYEDLRDTCYKDGFFDSVVSISTLEHVGMDNAFLYTPDKRKRENSKYAYLDAIREFKRVLKKGGILYLTMPYGRYKNHNWFQVFNSEMVTKIIEEFSPSDISETYFKYENNQWNFSDAEACKDGCYFDIHKNGKKKRDSLAAAECVVCLEVVK